MTYCVGLKVHAGMVFLSDSRTNAGVDHVGMARKMLVFERPGERVLVMLASGNLSITQSVQQILSQPFPDGSSVWSATNLFDAATVVGQAVRHVYDRDAAHLARMGIEFNCTLIFGGQILGERQRLFQVYNPGNFIEATDENPYFQIGELKYGKPILDRVVAATTSLDEAAKCALVSMDSTLRSNISVGLPLDLLCYEADSLRVTRFVNIDSDNEYFRMVRHTWEERLKEVFSELPDPSWQWSGSAVAAVRMPMPAA